MTDVPIDPLHDPARLLAHDGPLSRDQALAALDHAARLMAASEYAEAGRLYQRVIGFDDAAITGAALLGLGEAFLRLDEEPDALRVWEEVTRLPDTPSTYPAWRNVAAARVRAEDLRGAIDAYREADRLAPAADRPDIASRLGWLAKETGDQGAASRYFAKARGDAGASISMILVAVTVIISLTVDPTLTGEAGSQIRSLLALDKPAVADGELWRLFTVTLVHSEITQLPFHIVFNMFALWLAGPFVERLYGRAFFLVTYALFAVGGSLLSFAFGDAPGGVGASGAIFGIFGLLFAASRIHHPVLDRQSRGFLGQLGGLLAINLAFGFLFPGIDNLGHIGGLITGVWIGALFVPSRVPTLRSMWQQVPGAMTADGGQGTPGNGATVGSTTVALRLVGVLALLGLMVAAWALGVAAWS